MAYTKKIWKDYPDTTTPITAEDLNNIENRLENGWIPLTGTFTYSSADSPTFVITTSVDLTGIVGLGMKIKLTQATTKYFIVTAITNNSITMYGGTDYTLTNSAISNVYYSMLKAPFGFPNTFFNVKTGYITMTERFIDGKILYVKRINFGTLPNATIKEVATGLNMTNISIHEFRALGKLGTNAFFPLPYSSPILEENISILFANNNVRITTNTNRTSISAYVDIYFTYN